jgi:sugar phosphate isomerase/epimerase
VELPYAVMNRRHFLCAAALAAGATSISAPGKANTSHAPNIKTVGLILSGGFGKEMQRDAAGTLKRLAEMGYQELEFGGTYGQSAAELRKTLDGLGLKNVAGGSSMAQLTKGLDKMLEEASQLGRKYVVCYWPWMDSGENKTLDDFRRTAARFNKLGEKCRQAGLRFAFHNHDKEFKPTEGQIPYHIFLKETDPALVTMELDLYWITKGGQQPLDFFRQYPGRFELWHVKDMDKTPEAGMTTVGQGIIDFPALFAQARQAGMKHFFVEHDNPPDAMQFAQDSYRYLKTLR